MPGSHPQPAPAWQRDSALQEVLDGLQQPQKTLSAKFFYDARGAALFDRICELPEYYLYRSEMAMLPAIARQLQAHFDGPMELVEFGAGSLVKVAELLAANPRFQRFYPIDIAGDHLRRAAEGLQQRFPKVAICPIEADFTQDVVLPERGSQRLGFFPGSTIGNFQPDQARSFLQRLRRSLGRGSHLLIGVDTKKCPHQLHRAYNDQAGVTAQFNLNILAHLNRRWQLGFATEQFRHYAFYHPGQGRIEMHLISEQDTELNIGPHRIDLAAGESIHTENSYKYTPDEFGQLAKSAGWQPVTHWLAEQERFAVYLLQAPQ